MEFDLRDFWAYLLAFVRLSALVAVAPVFSSRGVPPRVRMGFCLLLAFTVSASLHRPAVHPPESLPALVGQAGCELVVGLTIGFLAAFVFSCLQMAGAILDTQIGFNLINVLNPFSESHGGALGPFLQQLGMTLFLIAGGHLLLVGVVADSYGYAPPGSLSIPDGAEASFLGLSSQFVLLAFRVAAPAAAALLVVDVAFAVLARTVPQMNVFLVGLPVKSIAGLATLAISLPVLAAAINDMLFTFGQGVPAVLGR